MGPFRLHRGLFPAAASITITQHFNHKLSPWNIDNIELTLCLRLPTRSQTRFCEEGRKRNVGAIRDERVLSPILLAPIYKPSISSHPVHILFRVWIPSLLRIRSRRGGVSVEQCTRKGRDECVAS
ncbi:hypothetical protein CGMCC3_g8568 [Colletotrichum fructicola]|nr:uncharacterized protein CGMCC3_g8568 [Colletotrichum fructicola]KAE9575345.1 hypothetical protein CGMCC3_g8568 [Colletotrichum fructicola]